MSELREEIMRALVIPREKALKMGYKNAKGALDSVSASFVGTTLNEGVRFFDRTTLNRGKNEISQGGETCDIRFTTNATSPFNEQKLGGAAISFFAERIIHFSNYNAIVDTLGDFYEVYEGASSANPGLDFGALIGDAVMNPGDTPGSLKLDVLYFKNQTMGSLREKAAGFEDAMHYMFGNADVPEVAPVPSGKTPDKARTPAEIERDEAYYSPVEVFIRDVTEAAIRSWGTDDERVHKNIAIAVRRAVREGLERGNERANAINNINMACDDVLSVFTGLTRENYHEKMEKYITMVTTRPELVDYYRTHSAPLPSGPIPTVFIRESLLEHYSKPENASGKPANLETMTRAELETLATSLGVMPSDRFDSFEHSCKMATMYGRNMAVAAREVASQRVKIEAAQREIAVQEGYWAYWADKYKGDTFEVAGITLPSKPHLPDATLRAGSNDALRTIINKREEAIRREIASGRHSRSTIRKLENEITVLRYDLDIINGKIPDTPKTRYYNGRSYDTRRPTNIHASITTQNGIIGECNSEIAAVNAYTDGVTQVSPRNNAMLLMTCCSILYDLNLNKLGGEIITANEMLERIGYDKVAGGIKYDPEYQKQALSILNNLYFLNEEQRVNSPTYPEGGRIHQTTEMFQHFVYQIYDMHAPGVMGEDGKMHYPPGKLPMEDLMENIKALGQDPNSPFFGRGKELMEQMTTALAAAKEAYAINNFNPVKACFAQMDPKLKNLSYRKTVMDYYKKEGLLPAKRVSIQQIKYELGQEYKPSTIVEPPPVVEVPEEIELLDYCEELGHALSKEHRYTAATKSKNARTSELQAASEAAEHKLLERMQTVFRKFEQHPQMFLYFTNAVVSGKGVVDENGKAVVETTEFKNGGIQVSVLDENGKWVTVKLTPDQRLMFAKFAPINGPMAVDKEGNPYFVENGLKKYFDEIQAYNSSARAVSALLKENPNITEEELKSRCGINRGELKAWCSSLKFGADYEKGVASSIFPKGMNPGVKLAFSLLTPASFVPKVDKTTGKIIGGHFAASIYGVQCTSMQHYSRVLARVGAQVEKDMLAITSSENFQLFGSLFHLRVVENQFVYAPAYKVGPRGGLEVRDNMDVKSDKVHAVPHKMEIDKVLEENPNAKVYVVEGGKPKELVGVQITSLTEPVIQLDSGVYIPASQVNQFVDVMAQEAKGKKRTIGVQESGGGIVHGLAEPVEIVGGLELNDPALATGDVPAPEVLTDPELDGVIPETPVA